MEQLTSTQTEFFNFIDKVIFENKKISHAYLIEVGNVDNYLFSVKEFAKKILISNNIEDKDRISLEVDNDNYPDIKFITPDGFWIKKEQLLSLEQQYFKKSMLNNKLIYVIDPAEKLNDSSANTILKFLEEPPLDVIAILVTKNRFNVLDTIVSRCQILSLKSNNFLELDVNEYDNSFIDSLNNPQNLLIKYDYYMTNLFSDKNTTIESLNRIENILFSSLNNLILKHEDLINEKLKSFSKDKFLSIINIIEIEKKNLVYNINSKLWLTNFIIKLIEVE